MASVRPPCFMQNGRGCFVGEWLQAKRLRQVAAVQAVRDVLEGVVVQKAAVGYGKHLFPGIPKIRLQFFCVLPKAFQYQLRDPILLDQDGLADGYIFIGLHGAFWGRH
jgi:hypothetical protein